MNLQETIRRILRQEVNEAYVKPNESTNRLINNWLTKLFSGSKMYHQKSYETRHDFYWCNKGKQIANVILFFSEDDSVYPDKRPTSERDFYEGNLSIPKSIIDDLITYVPIRKHYLKHRIIEWFEENIFPEVIEKMGRDDIEIDGISEYPSEPEVCVPPVEKPEGVTQEDMIDLILKTTLFKRNELLKYEEDSPGYIERVYLGKLQNAEIERLRRGINESDPKTGTGKKPKGSGRRLYTDENPSDTVSVKFRTKEDIVDTLNKDSFKSKPHKRQSQIINLIHQRVRAAYQNAKDPETKQRLKRAYDYIETVKEKSKEKTIRLQKQEQNETISEDKRIVCEKCEWSWDLSDGGNDPYTCHKCGHTNENDLTEYSRTLKNARKQGSGLRFPKSAVKNNPLRFRPYNRETVEEDTQELTEKCWPGYTQKGMKTMFGKRYPNCVKKTKK